jgi:hypothetical protein
MSQLLLALVENDTDKGKPVTVENMDTIVDVQDCKGGM